MRSSRRSTAYGRSSADMDLGDELYKEIILDNYKSKKNRRRLEDADLKREGFNPSCGDDIELFLKLDGETVTEATYEGVGCSICVASANMLCNAITGASVEQATEVLGRMRAMLVDGEEPDFPDAAADLEALQGVKQFPVRIKCAMLAWNTLEQMLQDAGLTA